MLKDIKPANPSLVVKIANSNTGNPVDILGISPKRGVAIVDQLNAAMGPASPDNQTLAVSELMEAVSRVAANPEEFMWLSMRIGTFLDNKNNFVPSGNNFIS